MFLCVYVYVCVCVGELPQFSSTRSPPLANRPQSTHYGGGAAVAGGVGGIGRVQSGRSLRPPPGAAEGGGWDNLGCDVPPPLPARNRSLVTQSSSPALVANGSPGGGGGGTEGVGGSGGGGGGATLVLAPPPPLPPRNASSSASSSCSSSSSSASSCGGGGIPDVVPPPATGPANGTSQLNSYGESSLTNQAHSSSTVSIQINRQSTLPPSLLLSHSAMGRFFPSWSVPGFSNIFPFKMHSQYHNVELDI